MEPPGILGSSKVAKVARINKRTFTCEVCDYTTCKKNNLEKHFLTRKHQIKVSGHSKSSNGHRDQISKNVQKCPKICEHCQENGIKRFFQTKSGRYRHMKKCEFNPVVENKKLKEVVEQQAKTIVNLNLEKKDVEIKLLKKAINIMEKRKGNTNINTQNNTKIDNQNNINVNLFLDKHCKNAMPIMDFIRNLQFTLAGINPDRPSSTIEAVSKQLIEGMKDLGETKRPIHCSDTKRQVFYVKDASGWEKDEDNKKIDKAIGWANMRHQAAWYTKAEREGLAKTNKDEYYLKMNVAMGTWSDDVKKSKKKVKRALARNTKIKEAMNKV